jgi:carboxymethylenebutenolidase
MTTATQEPTRLTASDFPKEVLTLFDRYVHGLIDRRAFVEGASKFTVAGMTADAILDALRPNYGFQREVPEGSALVKTEYVEYDSPQGNGRMRGLMAWPEGVAGPYPAVLVVHENRGLNPYQEDVVRRFAAAGFLSFGPDALTPLGGYAAAGNDEKGAEMQRQLDGNKVFEDFVAAAELLIKHKDSTGKLGATGFCFGGGVVNRLAVRLGSKLQAAAPFYGAVPPVEDVAKIQAPIMAHLGGLDERINAQYPAYEAALKAAGKSITVYTYANANHGFHNNTTPRYDEAAAKLAQQRTIDFFNKNLRTQTSE